MFALCVIMALLFSAWLVGLFAIDRLGRHPASTTVLYMTVTSGASAAVLLFLVISGLVR